MSAREWRDNLLEFLRVVSDPERQRAWEREERVAHVPWELVEEWFDLYHPEVELFREAFSPDELTRLAVFHDVIKAARPLPDASVNAMLQTEAWQRMVLAAKHPLQWTDREGKL